MEKTLLLETFSSSSLKWAAEAMVSFINKNNITQEQILNITSQSSQNTFILFYYSNT